MGKGKAMRRLSAKLEPWLKHYYQLVEAQLEKGVVLSPALAREGLATLTAGLVTDSPELPQVYDERVQGSHGPVPVRVYHPDPGARLPVLVYCHGGGHMAGSISVYDPICRKLARASRHIVVCVEYRLAPEHPYPAERLHMDEMIHAFLNLEDLVKESCRSVYQRIGEFLNRAPVHNGAASG